MGPVAGSSETGTMQRMKTVVVVTEDARARSLGPCLNSWDNEAFSKKKMLAIEALREAIQKIKRSQEVHLNVQRRLDEAAGLMRQCAGDERHAEQTVLDLESRITSARGWYRSCSEDVAAVNQTLGHSRREREGLVTEIESAKVKIAEATKSLERFASPSAPAAIPSPADLKRPGPAIAEKHTAEKALLQAKRAVKRLEEEYLEASLREERATSGGAWRRENAARSQRALAELEKELEKAKAMVSRSRELGRVLYVTKQERDEACDAVWRAISEADAALSEAKRSKATEADSKEITELEGRLAVAKDPLAALPDVVLASIISQCFGDQLAEIAAVGLVSKRWLAASRHPAIWFVAYHDRFRPCITMLSSSIDWFHRCELYSKFLGLLQNSLPIRRHRDDKGSSQACRFLAHRAVPDRELRRAGLPFDLGRTLVPEGGRAPLQ